MKEKEIIFEKEGHRISVDFYVCDCGEEMQFIDSAGCSHDDDWTYFYQCPSCKTVRTAWRAPRQDESELTKYGWKRLQESNPNES